MLFIRFQNNYKILWYLLLLLACDISAITIGTYNLPPFSMYEDGENIGMTTGVVSTLLDRSGISNYEIINYPLARGLAELQSGRIDIYYPYVINDTKEVPPYILIGPIAKYKIALFVRTDYSQKVSLAAMQNLVIGAERGSISDALLQKHNMHIEKATQAVSCLRMVVAQRVVACAIGTLPGMYAVAINNLAPELRFVETKFYADMYVALGQHLPEDFVKDIKKAYELLKRENYFTQQQLDYEQKFDLFIKSLS